MKLIKTLAIMISLSALTGCGIVGNKIISNETLAEKAAFALNTTPNKVKISNRKPNIEDIRFIATVGRKSYQCYVASIMGISTSDALCSGSASTYKNKPKNCNALLKAAGRC